MPTGFRRSKLRYTGRAFRQDADQAMRGDILRGLVEAITNADDAYGDAAGPILVQVSRAHGRTWSVSVVDHACGIPLDEMERRLATIGGRTSGHESGARVRGNRGRGAKDLAAYGTVRWESIVDGRCGALEIDRNGRYRLSREGVPATPEIRERTGIERNGTRVTIVCRENVSRPRFETLINKLERCVPLRDIMQNEDRIVRLIYLDDPAIRLRYLPDRTVTVVDRTSVNVPGYPGAAQITVAESREPLPGGPGDILRENGLLIKSGRAVHDASLFAFEMDPYAAYFTGEVRWDTIDDLVRDFDRRDERGREPSRSNPFSIISRTRDGLEKTHPAYEALRNAVEPVLRAHVERRRGEDASLAAESAATRKRLNQLARVVMQFSADKEEELEIAAPAGSGGVAAAPALRIVPSNRRIELGESARFTVHLRGDLVAEPNAPPAVLLQALVDPRDAVTLDRQSVELVKGTGRAETFTGTFVVRATGVACKAVIEATAEHVGTATATLEVAALQPEQEPASVEAPAELRFQQARYTIATGRRRFLTLLAPEHVILIDGTHVLIRSTNDDAVPVRDAEVELRRSPQGAWHQARICVEGRRDGAEAQIVASLGMLEATTEIHVGREETGQAVAIEIGQFEGAARARYQQHADGNATITINALHPAARRYMGEPPEFPGQESPAARLLIAEIVAEEVVRNLLNRKYRGARVDADAYNADRLTLLADLLPLCHRSQISNAEAESFAQPPEKAPKERSRRHQTQAELFR